MFSNITTSNSDQSDSTESSMKESDILKPAAKTATSMDTGGFSLLNNQQIRYAFKNPPMYTFGGNVMNQQSPIKTLTFNESIFQCDPRVYQKYVSRIETFRTWPKSHPLRPDQLCRAGFAYTGEGDKVICPWCRIKLIDWEPHDIPFDEHKRHSTSCDFLNMLMP